MKKKYWIILLIIIFVVLGIFFYKNRVKNSKLGKKAKEYLDAMANYVPLERDEIFVTASKDYKTNLLEVEAYKKQRNSLIATTILENLNLSCV